MSARHSRLLCIFSAASLVLLVGFTRVVLGAHFLPDVLAANFFGIIWLMLCTVLGKSVRPGTVASAISATQGARNYSAELGRAGARAWA
ncbi:MAG: hypothetical protein DMF01_07125 [Verrucomicrobia bacterium]|nr:MAG: hypothetical protein DMF01_07125 [Verrucomicrobiota bacterium]